MSRKLHFPSSPKRPPTHTATFRHEGNELKYSTVGFCTPEALRSYIDLALDGAKFTWEDSNCIYVPDHGVRIFSAELEEAMETEEVVPMPHPYNQQAAKVMGRPYESFTSSKDPTPRKERKKQPATPKKARKPRPAQEGMVTIGQIADELGLSASKARKMLRDAKIDKPAHGWSWSEDDAKDIKKRLK